MALDPATAISLGFAAIELAALMYDHAQRNGATPEQLAAFRAKAFSGMHLTADDVRVAQGPDEGSGA